jgi:hypothetical protein
LWWGRELIREFGKRKSAQKLVLDKFTRSHWTKKEVDFTSTLHQLGIEGRRATQWIEDTVHNLNHGLRRVRFHMDSKQRLIWWEAVGK